MDERLLRPGWGGLLTLQEAQFIAAALVKDAGLRRQWGFPKRQRYPLVLIAQKAFPENPEAARQHLENQMQAARRQKKARSNGNVGFGVSDATRQRA